MALNDIFKARKEMMEKKYAAQIAGISHYNNVDLGVAFDMLVYNYRAVCAGDFAEVKKGGGVIDYAELGADMKLLDEVRRK